MSLEKEISQSRKEIVSDGYEMSIGEIINLYKEDELKINPEFQRLFRWDITRLTGASKPGTRRRYELLVGAAKASTAGA